MEPMVWSQAKHLYEVEKLSIRQIAQKLRMARKTVARVIRNERVMRSYPDSILRPYERLIAQWYQEYPFLKASQVYERLKAYEFTGSYTTVSLWGRGQVLQSYINSYPCSTRFIARLIVA